MVSSKNVHSTKWDYRLSSYFICMLTILMTWQWWQSAVLIIQYWYSSMWCIYILGNLYHIHIFMVYMSVN